jgi:DNA topoisomerase-3
VQTAGEARVDADDDQRRHPEAFKHLRDGVADAGLADAARCRSESDWLIGINGTRALTKRMFGSRAGNVASVGRVQTPTLAIVYARELEIRNFKPRDYWRVTAKFEIAKGDLRGRLPAAQLQDRERRTRPHRPHLGQGAGRGRPRRLSGPARRGRHRGKEGQHLRPRRASTTSPPSSARPTTASACPARRTLQIAQALYERHKMITYPRTDSRALPEDYIPTCRQTLRQPARRPRPRPARAREGWVRPNKRIFNNAQISDHFAIIPTPTRPRTSTRWRPSCST